MVGNGVPYKVPGRSLNKKITDIGRYRVFILLKDISGHGTRECLYTLYSARLIKPLSLRTRLVDSVAQTRFSTNPVTIAVHCEATQRASVTFDPPYT